MGKTKICVIDDEESLVFTLTQILDDYEVSGFTKPYDVITTLNLEKALNSRFVLKVCIFKISKSIKKIRCQ